MEKVISIIIPCYNVEPYLDRCFASLEQQTLGIENMELIFVNDASTDGTLSKLQLYESKYPESVLVINVEENMGQGAARNLALQYASADYVGFVDSDDYVDYAMFEDMLKIIKQYDCDFVECDWDFFSVNENEFTKNSFEISGKGYQDFSNNEKKYNYIVEQLFFTSLWTKIFKKDFLLEKEIACPEGLKYEDMYFCFLAILYANSYFYLDKSFYHYFLNPNGTIQQRKASYQLDMMEVSLLFLETCKKRHLYEVHKDIIDWMFLEKYYVYLIWDIWDIYPEQSYECYLQLKEAVKNLIPDYKNNPFRKLDCNHLDDFLLRLIDYPLEPPQFIDLMQKLKLQQKNTK